MHEDLDWPSSIGDSHLAVEVEELASKPFVFSLCNTDPDCIVETWKLLYKTWTAESQHKWC